MNNKKSTKRTLTSSVLALILCMAMFIGTTFAWFTDNASAGVNSIQSGTLDVALMMKNSEGKWVSAEGEVLNFVKAADAPANEAVLWEPGCTYELPELKIVNQGNLALKYEIVVTWAKGDLKLLEVIDWTVNGVALDTMTGNLIAGAESDPFTIKGHMQESAGNEYQGLTIEGVSISVYATQDTVEYDSFDNQYDVNAPRLIWDGTADTSWYTGNAKTYELSTPEQLAGLAKLVNAGDAFTGITITLAANMDLNNLAWTPIGTTSAPFNGTLDGAGYTIYNLNVSGEKWLGLVGYVKNAASIYNVTIDGATVVGYDYVGSVLGGGYLAKDCVAGCAVENAVIIANPYWDDTKGTYDGGAKAGVVAGYAINGNIYNNKAIDSKVYAYRDLGGIVGMVSGENRAVSAYGNTVENVSLYYTTVDGKYDEDKTNGNMASIVGRASNATVRENYGEVELNETPVAVAAVNEVSEFKDSIADNKGGEVVIVASGQDLNALKNYTFPADTKVTIYNAVFEDTVGIRYSYVQGDVTFVNCVFDATSSYAYHTDGGKGTIDFQGCAFHGWVSYGSSLSGVTFSDCEFYGNGNYGTIRAWCNTTITNCSFDYSNVNTEDDYSEGVMPQGGATVTINNCNLGANAICTSFDSEDGKIVYEETTAYVDGAEDIAAALTSGVDVVMTSDVDAGGQVFVNKGSVLDGNGKTLTVSSGDAAYESGLTVTEGTVKNITVAGAYRGLGVGGSGASEMTGDVTYENVIVTGATYGVNIGIGNGHKLTMISCTIPDWNSYSGLGSAQFTDCTFTSEGTWYAAQRISANATFTYTNCKFEQNTYNNAEGNDNYYLDSYGNGTIVFENCYMGDTLVTSENLTTLFQIDPDNNTTVKVVNK
ncbi:MAG: hypothetical protein IJZ53_03340 [Tyzzerella sp.]|nr:hypothetical protein [Tyzzerella sp.]